MLPHRWTQERVANPIACKLTPSESHSGDHSDSPNIELLSAYCTPLCNIMKKLQVIPTSCTHSSLCQYEFSMKGYLHDDKNIDRIFVFTECAWDKPIVVRIHHWWVEDSVNLNKQANKHSNSTRLASIRIFQGWAIQNSKFKIWLLKKTSSWQLPWSDHSSCQARILLCSPFQSQWPAWSGGGGILNLQNKSDFRSTRWLIALIHWFVLLGPSLRVEGNWSTASKSTRLVSVSHKTGIIFHASELNTGLGEVKYTVKDCRCFWTCMRHMHTA